MQFGEQLRRHRRAAGLSQEELAEKAGLTANGVSALERGVRTRPYPHTVRALAVALRLSDAEREQLIGATGRRATVATPKRPAPDFATSPPAPVPPGVLVGRADEVAQLSALLERADVRLVTVTGPGGVGKTRLSLEVLRGVDAAAFVPLAPLHDPALVPSAIATAVGLPDNAGAGVASLVQSLRERNLLLVLDNYEHVLAAAPVVAELLAGCPSLSVLVSSRAPLRVRGETEFAVRPLDVPSSTRDARPADVVSTSAGLLFLDRARSVDPSFEVTAENAADVATICRRLGGLPLAVELAAAKLRALTPHELLTHLDTALSAGWARDLPERQQTMRATLDWSYRLLQPDEQRVFRYLSVFTAPFSLEAADSVAQPLIGATPVLAVLDALAEQSLLVVTRNGDGSRYALLEPIRQYGAELLQEAGEVDKAERALSAHYLRIAERAFVQSREPDQVGPARRTEAGSEDLRVAIVGALARGDGETAARLCFELWLG